VEIFLRDWYNIENTKKGDIFMEEYRIALELIRRRRSCRAFEAQAPAREVLEEIIEAGRYAPSGMNRQRTRFFVAQGEKVKKLSAIVSRLREDYKDKDCTYGAPVLVLVTNREENPNAKADAGCVMQNMMLAASAVGVGSVWINQFGPLSGDEELRALLGLEEDEFICAALALGKPAGDLFPGVRERTGHKVIWL